MRPLPYVIMGQGHYVIVTTYLVGELVGNNAILDEEQYSVVCDDACQNEQQEASSEPSLLES